MQRHEKCEVDDPFLLLGTFYVFYVLSEFFVNSTKARIKHKSGMMEMMLILKAKTFCTAQKILPELCKVGPKTFLGLDFIFRISRMFVEIYGIN